MTSWRSEERARDDEETTGSDLVCLIVAGWLVVLIAMAMVI